jgi:hypothetical protein
MLKRLDSGVPRFSTSIQKCEWWLGSDEGKRGEPRSSFTTCKKGKARYMTGLSNSTALAVNNVMWWHLLFEIV